MQNHMDPMRTYDRASLSGYGRTVAVVGFSRIGRRAVDLLGQAGDRRTPACELAAL
ncbi:hypothetical protein [Arthrobacter bambusae]|uniref:Phosphoglycerate dehydrogenase-like enzyme n=1 Tax=Arthrobacter bambusae TaxID=1338426 RepID=A0AAW8DG46_9MICC|nr:hypothetical protein [Arthrobacter bambusae]MDP9905533.1 phosphoglycerate dehydrogenase-like enzyme [Arthrobacter bambusae]MDQ0127385.1 phosphoglycerate dehydrogenase-like enzyme [Arthrobacter bambusae]MDQ0178727.1 phosphoglycerate dehydrogenase-like enzyme [Arthrobacter bambusae]